jgi:hypothetical protein
MNPVESVRRHIYKGLRSGTNLFIHNSLRSIIHLLIVCWMVHLMFLFYKERLTASLTFSTISSVVIAAPWCLWSLHSSTLFSKSSYLRLFTNISSRLVFKKWLKDDWNFWTDFRQSLPYQCLRCRVIDHKSGSLRFSQFSGCWLILSVYIIMSFDFPFVRLFGVR